MLTVTPTCNNLSTIYTGFLENANVTWADNSSKLLDLQMNGVSRFNVGMWGAVGIGTTAPISNLEVSSVSTDSTQIMIGNSSGSHQYQLAVTGSAHSYGPGYLAFWDQTVGATRMIVSPSGNVGIGTTAPSYRLHNVGTFLTKGSDFELDDGGVNDSTGVRLFSNSGNLYLQNGAGNNIYFRNKTAIATMTIQNGGNVGIGTTSPSYKLHVVGSAGLSSGTAWTLASDIRLKDVEGDYEYGLAEVKKLHTIRFKYKKDNPLKLPYEQEHTGFIAQEVKELIPDAVITRADGYLELNVDPIHWATVNAVKELALDNDRLKAEAASLRARADKADIEATQLKAESAQLKAESAQLKARADQADAESAQLRAALCNKFSDLPVCIQ